MYKLTNLPNYIYVLGYKVHIEQDTKLLDSEGNSGTYCEATKTITLASSYKTREEAEWTLVYEVAHATIKSLAPQLDPHLEEILVDALARSIAQNFRLISRYAPRKP